LPSLVYCPLVKSSRHTVHSSEFTCHDNQVRPNGTTPHFHPKHTVAGIKTTRAITQVLLSEDVKRESSREGEWERVKRRGETEKNEERQKESGEGQEEFFKD
jgi:hypothetical protein